MNPIKEAWVFSSNKYASNKSAKRKFLWISFAKKLHTHKLKNKNNVIKYLIDKKKKRKQNVIAIYISKIVEIYSW